LFSLLVPLSVLASRAALMAPLDVLLLLTHDRYLGTGSDSASLCLAVQRIGSGETFFCKRCQRSLRNIRTDLTYAASLAAGADS
jgi:hypothetical protein